MTSKTRSFIWKIPPQEFKDTIANSTTWSEVVETYYGHPANARVIKARVKKENIDVSHFLGRKKTKNTICEKNSHPKYSLKELLVYNPAHKLSNQRLKTRMLKEYMLQDQCYTCGLKNRWNGKPLTLQLIHMNGDSYDNQLENIILQCPNCFSQLRNNEFIVLDECCKCGINVPLGEKECKKCERSSPKRPSKETLQKELTILDFEGVQRKYDVSKETIVRWININTA
jgi:hypothetical protein